MAGPIQVRPFSLCWPAMINHSHWIELAGIGVDGIQLRKMVNLAVVAEAVYSESSREGGAKLTIREMGETTPIVFLGNDAKHLWSHIEASKQG